MTPTRESFLGIPVQGEVNDSGSRQVPQRPLEELEPLLRAVIDDDHIRAFGWDQYTPYFNDGDPCVFRVGDLWFVTAADQVRLPDEEEGDEDEEFDGYDYGAYGHPTLGDRPYNYGYDDAGQWTKSWTGPYQGEHETTWTNCAALAEAIGSGAFNNVLLDAFGDHAQVIIRRTGITIDEYSHD